MKIFFSLLLLSISLQTKSQISVSTISGRTINTAVPFLRITPDACAGGMGDEGIATTPNLYSIYWNTAKLNFAKDKSGFGFTYSPWLKELMNDIFLLDLSFYHKIDSLNAITASIRYFSLGSIVFTDMSGKTTIENYNPREFAFHFGYSRKLAKHFSTGINLGYIYSNLAKGQSMKGVPIKAGTSLSTDLSCYYSHPKKSKSFLKEYDLGFVLSNLGSKIQYSQLDENREFLPTNIGIGSAFHFQFNEKNKIEFTLEANKIVSPDSGDPFIFSAGSKYTLNHNFFRAGYFYDENKSHATVGLGYRIHFLQGDISYLIPVMKEKNPTDNTLRFGLSFLFPSAKIRKEK